MYRTEYRNAYFPILVDSPTKGIRSCGLRPYTAKPKCLAERPGQTGSTARPVHALIVPACLPEWGRNPRPACLRLASRLQWVTVACASLSAPGQTLRSGRHTACVSVPIWLKY